MPLAEKAGFPTSFTTFGQGPRAALMIHCSLGHSGSWGGLARHLSGALTMTAFDLPGHGRSAPWGGGEELQALATDMAADFCTDGPRDVIGHSFGATVALRLALERPGAVRSLTLIEPVLFAVALSDRPDLRAPFAAQMRGFRQALEAGDRLAATRAFTVLWGDGTAWEDLPEPQRRALSERIHLIAAGDAALYDDAGGLLRPGRLEALEIPVLLIEGSRSPVIIPAINEGLAARLARPRRAVIAGASHMAPVTHAGQVASELLRFLDEL